MFYHASRHALKYPLGPPEILWEWKESFCWASWFLPFLSEIKLPPNQNVSKLSSWPQSCLTLRRLHTQRDCCQRTSLCIAFYCSALHLRAQRHWISFRQSLLFRWTSIVASWMAATYSDRRFFRVTKATALTIELGRKIWQRYKGLWINEMNA